MSSQASRHVKVVIRTRPTSDFAQSMIRFDDDRKGVHIHIPKGSDGGFINNQQENWDFRFDNILHNCSQEKVYEDCARGIVKSVVEGYNGLCATHQSIDPWDSGTIMAYGQTGAGKTFTMTGATENYKHRGIIPRAISHVFREISDRPQLASTVRISYLEIYNEQIVDLLASLGESQDENLAVVEDKNGISHVKGSTVQVVCNEEEALNLLFEGETNRSIAEHHLNKSSTRSHCIFTIQIESRSRVESTERVLTSKLNLVDLAGSERVSKTQTHGLSLKEAMYINKSLTFLEQVIIALADKKREHIPYRQSKLTHVLRDSLGGNCNTLMIANIWGEKDHIEETISTLRFATRMMCVTNSPELNIQFDPLALLKKYEREIKELKQELAMHDSLSNRSHVQYEPFGEQQRAELQKAVRAYLDEDEGELEVISLRQIREMFRQFRIVYRALETECHDLQATIKRMAANPQSFEKATTAETNDHENGRFNADNDKEERVGDIENHGFGIGLAQSAAGKQLLYPKKGTRKKAGRTTPFTPAMEAGAGRQDDDEEFPEIRAPDDTQLTLPNIAKGQLRLGRTADHIHHHNNRALDFETFKRDKGAEIFRVLCENKAILKEKKRTAKELVDIINVTKAEIDKYREKVSFQRGNEGRVIGAEDFNAIERLKFLKKQYKDHFDQLKQTRVDIAYCTRLVDQCRQKLMADFEAWYTTIYGAQISELEIVNAQTDDVMDIGEKFDKLQIEKMSQEDPDSLPFYNARKNTERKKMKLANGPLNG
ncbi:Kinesin-like protein kif9 [Phlyctochytrium bullatum]|nr:Kinesin-like protein kif9 [Phlyctochytrium bullatum]